MKHKLSISLTAIALGLGLVATTLTAVPDSAQAKPPVANKKAAPLKPLKRDISLAPDGLRWGLGLPFVSKLYEDWLDAAYVPLYKKADPGPETAELDADLADKKALIRRHQIEFGTTPTGVDQSPLKGEYSYNNGESMTKISLAGGTTRYFFFFSDRLWKVYDEYKLGAGSKLGGNWEGAIETLTQMFGGPPTMMPADPAVGRQFDEAVWITSSTHIRAINRDYQKIVAVAWADKSVQDNLASKRPNKMPDPTKMDRSVRDVTTPDPSLSPKRPPPDETKKK